MGYKVMEIYRDLPKTNCKECGKPGCLPFATAVYLEGCPLSKCPDLGPEKLEEMEEKLAEERRKEQNPKQESVVQALAFLTEKIKEHDLQDAARKTGGEYVKGPPEAVRLKLLGKDHLVSRDGVSTEDGGMPVPALAVLLLIYVTRATGVRPSRKWKAFRELPNTMSKAGQYEEVTAGIARRFSGAEEDLKRAAESLGGVAAAPESADFEYVFDALPRVNLRLLFWAADEDFDARASLLLDDTVLEYLDQEAIVFLSEVLAAMLAGEDVARINP
jgi:hypothetical protein